ncbi:cysteine desulfurase family protein [Alkaliphilus oremlandii]|uniref:Aminotransferase class V n=1 Tax=Alkaliphilus oremlandii (strain OhILAs) TaxID=350688 RepID=A8MHS2_ALKOO|nr:cysteine desulfurase family protein [Alkaliphilus oremlandii]ABW19354.1 aminotransferase class V [Alkaliphilus oremlandii OhILAs]
MEVYLDNAATTKPREEVVEAMLKALKEAYGNPSSLHRKGMEVEKEIKRIRRIIAKALGCTDQEIIFTSSGTEANNLAIRGIAESYKRSGNHIITSKIEHKSILSTLNELEKKGFCVTYLDVDRKGFISLDQLKDSITDQTILVSIMHVNNEIGSIEPIKEISKIIKDKNPKTLFHVDGIQSFGKIKFSLKDFNVDSFSISGHKIQGPKGIGALYVKKGTKITPILSGGNQEMGIRSGTENVPGIYGLGEAVRLSVEEQNQNIAHLKELRDYFIEEFSTKIEDVHITSEKNDAFAPHIINVSFPGVRSEIMLHSLEQDGIYVSSGSACSSKRKGFSHVLEAIRMNENLIDSALRFSLSHRTTKAEVDYALEKTKEHYTSLKRIIKR